MKFAIVLAVCVALAAASGTNEKDGSTSSESSESRQRMVTRTEKKKGQRHPDEIQLLNGVQQCLLCRETWGEALNSFNNEVNVDGTITQDKTCRSVCRGSAMKKIERLDEGEKNEMLCDSCRIGVDFWRAQPSKKVHYQLAKENMCNAFTHQITREDCEHTVRMYGFDIFNHIREGVSSNSICHIYNLCGRQTVDFSWEEDEESDMLEKDLQSVSLAELNPKNHGSKSSESSESQTEKEENGVSESSESTGTTSSEEREKSIKEQRKRSRDQRRKQRKQEREERHRREREELARRQAEESEE